MFLPEVSFSQANSPVKEENSLTLSSYLERTPLFFIENKGQLPSAVQYYLNGVDKTVHFSASGMTIILHNAEDDKHSFSMTTGTAFQQEFPSLRGMDYRVKLNFIGTNANATVSGGEPFTTKVSYFKGKAEEWHTDLPAFSQIVYHELWSGIDLVFYGTQNRLKYEFIVKPGADPRQIRMAYEGATKVTLTKANELEIQTPLGAFRDQAPFAYQLVNGKHLPVDMSYILDKKNEERSANYPYHFAIGNYDPTLPLILDPEMLIYAGFIGGGQAEQGYSIAVDAAGNAYVTGYTYSNQSSFPVVGGPDLTQNGDMDAFVAKVKADGSGLAYLGFIGGAGIDYGSSIAVDSAGNAYIVGYTRSNEASFPVIGGPDGTHNGDVDAFVAKVNPAGTALVYAGFVGGNGFDWGAGITLDPFANVYVAGNTASNNLPTIVGPDLSHNGGIDTFVGKLKPDGSGWIYLGYLGGVNAEAVDTNALSVDPAGNAYVTGATASDQTTFPVNVGPDLTYNGGASDAFVAKVRSDGAGLTYAGYIGGNDSDSGRSTAVDATGNLYATGTTSSTQATFPVISGPDLTANGKTDAFSVKVKADGSGLLYSSFVGGSNDDAGAGIAVDSLGNAYIVGLTSSDQSTFPAIGGPDLTANGNSDAFITKIKADGTAFIYSGFMGGTSSDYGVAIAVDSINNAYVTGYTNSDESSFPVLYGPDLTFNGNIEAFVAKISENALAFETNLQTLAFNAVQGRGNPASQSFTIKRVAGPGKFNWSITPDVPWLSLSYSSPDISPTTVNVLPNISGLNPGVYTGKILIAATSSTGESNSVAVQVSLSINVGTAAVLQVSPNHLAFEAVEGTAAPMTSTINIQNGGDGNLNWVITKDAGWLAVATMNGTTVGEVTSVGVSVTSIGLSAGVYSSTLTVTAPGAQNTPQTVLVLLRVTPTTPHIQSSLSRLVFFAENQQGNPTAQEITLSNIGGGNNVGWTINETIPWLTFDKNSGTLPSQIKAHVDITGINQGSYSGEITIASPDAVGSPLIIPVSLQVNSDRQLVLSAQRFDFNFVEGETPSAQTFSIRNQSFFAASTIPWQATSDVAWIKLDQNGGAVATNGTGVNVSLDTSQLKPGTHSGKITIKSDSTVQGNTQTINVLVAIADKATPKCLPSGSFTPIKTTGVRLHVSVASVVNKDSGCDISGTAVISLPQNILTVAYAGQVDGGNKFQASVSQPITLEIANVKLMLADIKLDDSALTARGKLSLESLGAGSLDINLVRIDSKGMSFDGKSTFPLSLKLNLEGFEFSTTQATIRVATAASAYELDIDGKIRLKIPGSPIDIKLLATVNKNGVKVKTGISVPIPNFDIQLAGLKFTVKGAKFGKRSKGQPPNLFANEATLKMPKEWGSATTTITNITIDRNGKVSIGGGSFKLPSIKAGGFNLLELKGSLIQQPRGYEIAAGGKFQIVVGPAGVCALGVNITLYAGANNTNVLEVESNQLNGEHQSVMFQGSETMLPNSPDVLALREFGVLLENCFPGVPIGNTPLFLTGVSGRVTLRANIQSVNVAVQVQTSFIKAFDIAAIYAEADATVSRNIKNGKMSVDFGGLVKLIGIEAARAHVHIDEYGFDATLGFNYVLINGEIRVFGGYSTRVRRHVLGGTGRVEIGIKKGALGRERICYVFDCDWVYLPPKKFIVTANVQVGTFSNGALGFQGYVRLPVIGKVGVFMDARGNLDFADTDKYQLIMPGQIQQAHQSWLSSQGSNQAATASMIDQLYTFYPDKSVSINISIPANGIDASAVNQNQPVTITLRSNVVFALVQPVTGTMRMMLLDPSGNEIKPEVLPNGVSYIETVDEDGKQSTYGVEQATPGVWQIHLTGNIEDSTYGILVTGIKPAPQLSDFTMTPTGTPNQISVNWRLFATDLNTKVSIYATEGPITETVTLTDTDGNVNTTVIPYYAGQPVAVNLPSATNGSLQSQAIDLSHLPSGIYSLWISAEDAQNPSVNEYVMQGAEVAKVAVVHNNDYPTTWTSVITPTSDSKNHTMRISWQLLSHPDIDSYVVSLRTNNPLSPTEVLTDEIVVSAATPEVSGSALIDGIAPGQAYIFTVCAQDEENLRRVCSPEQSYTPPQPDFLVSTVTTNLNMTAGQTIVATIKVETPDDLSYPIGVEPNYELLPDGFEVLLESDEAVMAAATSEIPLYILADETMLPGDYVVPVIAYSGNLERDVVLNVHVLPKQGSGPITIFMPIIMR
jgi:hypothetical protein